MKATRRAMLLALGVDVTDIPVAELEKPTEATLGDDEWVITELSVSSFANAIDVASHGDSETRYVAGPHRQSVHLVVMASEKALAVKAGRVGQYGMPELQLEDVVGNMRLRAKLLVRSSFYTIAPACRSVMATFECEVVGKIDFERVHPEPASTGRRGMAL